MSLHKKIKAHIKAHILKRHHMENQIPETNSINPNLVQGTSKLVYILVFLGLLIAIGVGTFFYISSNKKVSPAPQSSTTPVIPTGTIAQVGEEYIYQNDLGYEFTYTPTSVDYKKISSTDSATLQAVKNELLAKIASDSAILQAAKADGLIQLDATIYNSPNKDYAKRVAAVDKIRQIIDENATKRSGSVITIWFDNGKPGPIGYEKGKQIAFEKITKLQADVKAKKITMQQAAEQIQKDNSLAQVDPSYKANSILNFNVKDGQLITFNKPFSELMWKLKEGEISDVFLGQDKEIFSQKIVDSLYMFGQVDKVSSNGNALSFDEWFAKKKGAYAVKYY